MTINKGDILAGTGTLNQFSALPAGTNGETIVYDSTQANGIKAASVSSTLLPYVDIANQQLFDGSSVLSADWTSRHLVDVTGAFGVVDWQFGQLDLPIAGNPPVVDWFSMQLNDQTITLSADWSQRYLYDSSGNLSLEWGNRFTFDSTGQYAIDWQNRALFDNFSAETVAWGTRILIDAASKESENWNIRQLLFTDGTTVVVDWATQVMFDQTMTLSLDWNNRRAYNSSSLSIDWANESLYDLSGTNSINWNTRELVNSSGDTTLSWEGQSLGDNAGSIILDWNQRQQYSPSGVLSIDWLNRQLIATDGTTVVVDWSVANGLKLNGSTINVNKSRVFSAQTLAVNTGRRPSTTNDTFINFSGSITNIAALNSNISLQSSPDNAVWTTLQTFQMPLVATAQQVPFSALIPSGYYYKWIATTSAGGTTAISTIQELTL